jgi:hypothetical protein
VRHRFSPSRKFEHWRERAAHIRALSLMMSDVEMQAMSEKTKETSPQKLAESRRDYLAQAKMLTVNERTHEAAEINKALHRCCGDSGYGQGRVHSSARLVGQ